MSAAAHMPTPYAVKKGLHGNPDGITIWQEKQSAAAGSKGIAKMSGVHEQAEIEATAEFIVCACNAHDQLVAALLTAESFIAGFEGDELQDGIDEKLAAVRTALAAAGAA